MFESTEIQTAGVRDIAPLVLEPDGRMKILPAAFWEETTPNERAVFGHYHGIYSFPTLELVDHLKEVINGRKAIEIGAGHGGLANALGISATDSCLQNRKKYKAAYAQIDQPITRYGRNVVPRSAYEAVRRYEPEVVIGCWITHRYEPDRHWAGGNEVGVDEEDVVAHCQDYIMVGNEKVHQDKKIWNLPHTKMFPLWLYSRATNGTPEFIATWHKEDIYGTPAAKA